MSILVKKLTLCIVFLSVVVFTVNVVKTQAQKNSQQSASGHGSYAVDTNQKRQFSFSAHKQKDGTVKGNAVIQNPAFDFRAQLEIQCLVVTTGITNPVTGETGNRADMGGVIRKSNDPGLPEGTRGFFTVFDYGEPGKDKDTISPVFFDSEVPVSNCEFIRTDPTAPSGGFQIVIETGNVQIRGENEILQ